MRVLIVTKIFPNALEPLSSPFNRQQFDALAKICDVQLLATIPWFPGAQWLGRWSAAGRLTGVPDAERIGAIEVEHPRFLFVPKIGHAWSGPLYAASLARRVLAARERIDVILGSWAYPDGWAAVTLGRMLGIPAVVKLHGSDMNVVAQMAGPRRRLQSALPRAARVVAVSRSLAERARELGVAPARVEIVQNGVDTSLFHPRDRGQARALLGLPQHARVITYVGRLEPQKGVLDLLEAFAAVRRLRPETLLALVGTGPSEQAALAGSAEGVVVAGAQPLARVPEWIAAADLLTLPSWNEGMPNVVLEALASGRRVVATDVGGIPEIISAPELGELVPRRQPTALAQALLRAIDVEVDPLEIVARSGVKSWQHSAGLLADVLERARSAGDLRRAA
jgi:teichuronic acid biosynthesis glycosyltransferase TuaC